LAKYWIIWIKNHLTKKNRIFFIGEAMNTNYAYGFIHGALETAEKVNEFF